MDTVTVPPFDELEDRILPWSQVKVICGLSRTTVWRMQKTGDFPACVQVSQNRVGWWQSELLAWRRARTPRRLPEPLVIKPVPGVDPPVSAAKASATVRVEENVKTFAETPAEPETSARSGRSRRRAPAPNQITFDFGS